MEQVFLFVIDGLKKGVENNYTLYFIIAFTLIPFICFLVEIILILLFKKDGKGEFYKCVTGISLLLLVAFSVSSFATNQPIFKSAVEVFYYNLALTLICYVFYILLKIIAKFSIKKVRQTVKEVEVIPQDLAPTNVKRIVETISCKTANSQEYSGYLNVDYLKQLIAELKKCDLEEKERLEIEELEVYLLNFVTRQPNNEERQVLSNYIGLLLKKLAKYNVVNE